MSEQQSLPLSVRPIINYPQEAQSGKTYLLEIDLEATGTIEEWKYEEEEYPIYCQVDSRGKDLVSSLFKVRCQGTPAVILHRFGGTYGAAKFYLTAVDKDIEGEIRITLSSGWGAPLRTIRLEQIRISLECSNTDHVHLRISNYSETLDRYNQKICQLLPEDPERKKLKLKFFQEANRCIQSAKDDNPNFDELDEHLRQLMDQARQINPKNSNEKLFQRTILNQCLESIYKSGKLWRVFKTEIIHEEAYNEALVNLYDFFMKHHRDYDPTKSKVITWLNMRLKYDYLTKIKRQYHRKSIEINWEENIELQSTDSSKAKLIYEDLCQWIYTDEDLKVSLDKKYPEVTISYLLEQRFILGESWSDIQKTTGASINVLSSCYERRCRPLLIHRITTHYDVARPDAAINPCKHIKGLLKERDKEFAEQFRHWIETAAELKGIEFTDYENDQEKSFSAYDFLCQLLERKMSLNKLSQIFFVSTEDLERFYEFNILPLILHFIRENENVQK